MRGLIIGINLIQNPEIQNMNLELCEHVPVLKTWSIIGEPGYLIDILDGEYGQLIEEIANDKIVLMRLLFVNFERTIILFQVIEYKKF